MWVAKVSILAPDRERLRHARRPPVTFEWFPTVRRCAVFSAQKAATYAVVRAGAAWSGPRCCTGCCTAARGRARPARAHARPTPEVGVARAEAVGARGAATRAPLLAQPARHVLGALRMTGVRPVPLAPCGARFLAPTLDDRSCRPGSLNHVFRAERGNGWSPPTELRPGRRSRPTSWQSWSRVQTDVTDGTSPAIRNDRHLRVDLVGSVRNRAARHSAPGRRSRDGLSHSRSWHTRAC